ncbi:glutamine amidotransferase [Diaporthe eres]|uniref:Glutamine amidotransferase type-2 domain-containing protein n=2 Tax=Diaporthe vaccinii TaxID=105482 RepID=A0ABR4EDD4_9PEZI|nr:glutamine amidotransferase [Diaporthe eres]
MCRFLVYKGSDEILLSKLILEPCHSILRQSFDSRLRLDTRRGANNADGFGIGYYTSPKLGAEPCIFTSTTPAWNDPNLQRIASKTASNLIFAHVRATTEGSTSPDNCHPFEHGSLMWMHNGGLGGWKHIKRRLAERLADKWYLGVRGGTDSEWAFALFLDTLERMGVDPSSSPKKGFGPMVLRKAMLKTIAQINDLIDQIPESILHSENIDTRSLLNFCVSDGHSIICTRYINSSTDEAASLYYSSGTQWETRQHDDNENYQMKRRDKGADVVLVSSEPLTFERENWINVPTNSILTIHDQTAFVQPIIDQFHHKDPWHRRSAGFVQSKGLAANEKTPTPLSMPNPAVAAPEGNLQAEMFHKRANLGPTIPFSLMRSITPQISRTTTSEAPSSFVAASPRPSLSTVDTSKSTDFRTVTGPPVSRQASTSNPPALGNIKKKRMSLSNLDQLQGPSPSSETEPPTPMSPVDRTSYGDPNKIAQYFPELTLSP